MQTFLCCATPWRPLPIGARKPSRTIPQVVSLFRIAPGSRTPPEILAHIGDLLDWGLGLADGRHDWHDSQPLPWDREVERFFSALKALDERLAAPAPLGFPATRIYQGPVADALTHIGQIAMLRRLAGAPVRAENYFRAHIQAGQVGPNQPAPVVEFD